MRHRREPAEACDRYRWNRNAKSCDIDSREEPLLFVERANRRSEPMGRAYSLTKRKIPCVNGARHRTAASHRRHSSRHCRRSVSREDRVCGRNEIGIFAFIASSGIAISQRINTRTAARINIVRLVIIRFAIGRIVKKLSREVAR